MWIRLLRLTAVASLALAIGGCTGPPGLDLEADIYFIHDGPGAG